MGLNAYQQAVSNLAKRLGLRGAAESQVYQRPEYFQLVEQLYGKIPLPPGIDPSQVISNNGAILEYKDAQGYVHRLERDLNGTSSQLGQVRESGTDRPPILPPPPAQAQAEGALNQQILGQLQGQFAQGVPSPPGLPNFQGLQQALSMIPRAPQFDFSQLFGQLNRGIPNAPQAPDLSAITGGINNLSGQFGQVFQGLMQPSQLANLQPQDLANLQAIKAVQDAQLNQQFTRGQDNLLTRLYGQGVEQSTLANRATADLLQAQGLVQQQANADAASRQLGLQQFLTQQGQGNLALAGQTLGTQANSLGTLGNLQLGQGRLGLDAFLGQQGLDLQRLSQLAQAMQGTGQLALGGYSAEQQARGNQLGQLQNLLLGQGQLGLQSYAAQQGFIGDMMSRAIQQLSLLNSQDLNRQVSSGQLGLGQAELAERQRQFNQQLSQRQEELRLQERLARPSLFDQIMRGISAGVSIAGAPFTGGQSLLGLFGMGGGSGAAQGGGFLTPQGGLPQLGTFGAPPLTGYGGSR